VHFLWAVKKDLTDPLLYGAVIAALLGWRAWVAYGKRPGSGR
jgi:sulfoxide reductase heme-binding subunit YedZ